MSVTGRIGLLALVAALSWPAAAAAQDEQGADRFFADKEEDEDADEDDTLVQGSLTSTSFAYRETGTIAQPLTGGMVGVENASSFDRIFTELRGRLDARHIKGKSWDFHADARARVTPEASENFGVQTSVFGDDEYEVREAYLKRYGVATDITFGRQFVSELAATKIDGLRLDYAKDDEWTYLAFAGLYPSRTSRSITEDYPETAPLVAGDEPGKRILPVAGGAGASYRFAKMYGAFGVVGVLPLADEKVEMAAVQEQPRVFVTSNGYYRRSAKLDLYHFAVIDLVGSNVTDRDELEGTLASLPLTNLSLGGNFRPNPNLRVSLGFNRVDTETLNVIAQTRLEDPQDGGTFDNNIVQNNINVQRISQQSARVGLSGAFKQQRFEISVLSLVRQRPEIRLTQADGMTEVIIPGASALELTLRAVDRRSIKKHRISASYTNILGFRDTNLYRTDANIVRLSAAREFKQGLGEYEVNLGYIQSADENRPECLADGPEMGPFGGRCFGTTSINTFSAGALVFYRPKKSWFVIGNVSAASQGITIIDTAASAEVTQPRILILTGLARIAYRF